MPLMTPLEFERMATRIRGGDVDHETLVDLLMGGFESAGLPASREQLLAGVRREYPTKEAVVAHLRAMLDGYLGAMGRAKGETEH